MSMPVIDLTGITRSFCVGDVEYQVLKGIDLTINEGDFIALMGPSGSGKSTLMNIVGCLDRPTSGTYKLNGVDISNLPDDDLATIRRDKLGFVFQTFNLIGRISVVKNVEIPMIFSETSPDVRNKRALELLDSVGLSHRVNFSPSKLSGGEKQRVAISRALANNPGIIIADEPTGALDTKSSDEVMNILKSLNDSGKTIVMVTHNPDITRDCNRVIHMKDGKIVEG
jgi:putative ABC transport system ATP-binding protein